MPVVKRLAYLRRIFASYVFSPVSQLSFWHERPEIDSAAFPGTNSEALGPYYMAFSQKADYAGMFDPQGVPMLDYHGDIGRQYNPIAIAQYGLGNFNLFSATADATSKAKTLLAADWLVENLEPNAAGLKVWNHKFDWEYRDTLRNPWYSGLAQGQGISLLLRAHMLTGDKKYFAAARSAFEPLLREVKDGGVLYQEGNDVWIEEYIVDPPTHILNGSMWALWGVWDHWLATKEGSAKKLFDDCVATLLRNLDRYDTGYWSLYEISGTRLPMIASHFYHSLHIVQLRVMHKLTGIDEFLKTAERWEQYQHSSWNRLRAWAEKVIFKLFYY